MIAVGTITQTLPSLALPDNIRQGQRTEQSDCDSYAYAHLLPYFSPQTYPPLTPFKHSDPAFRALSHPNPRSFLDIAAAVIEITPNLGTEIRGVNLARLDGDGRLNPNGNGTA